ncbi:hypothetical protein N658DRAFT_507666 [Parathielavia hyrcaniae]|uniref:Uncharacterized protein n=1 Tax=Parathielavia hyrcaniae TaxID=113614 RepID=A0AAN6T0V6_9PEZI|nr:hypothetical protein N658DRAFT_507666 [Parathielavia hyrcaniae]
MSLTLPYSFELTLRQAENDGSDRPCILRWSPTLDGFRLSGFLLLHHTAASADGFEPLDIDHSGLMKPRGGFHHRDWTQPGPLGRHYRALRPRETYTLLYPGGEAAMWDWGTIRENTGKVMQARHLLSPSAKDGLPPALLIPGGACVSFTAKEEETPWPGRAEAEARNGFGFANMDEDIWRREEAFKAAKRIVRTIEERPASLGPEDRVLETLVLTVSLECPPTMSRKGDINISLNVTYTGQIWEPDGQASSKTTTRPITFRSWSVIADLGEDAREGFRLGRRRGGNAQLPWELCYMDDGGCEGYIIYDDPDVPGLSWSYLPDDTAVADVFRYWFTGAFVEWWDWGGVEEHAETVVMLPCWIADRVVEPRENGGRPKLVVPGSEPVDFKIVE